MPFNTALYPIEWGNFCPGTQAEEVDEIGELRRQLIVLRNQHLLATRKGGVSLAELQNQSIQRPHRLFTSAQTPPPQIIVNNITTFVDGTPDSAPIPSAPPVNSGATYLGGGLDTSPHGQVEKFTYSTEKISALSWALSQVRFRHCGTASASIGYWFGGQTTHNISGRTANIEGIVFATEKRKTVSNALTTTRVDARAAGAFVKAYIAGNISPLQYTVDRFTHGTEAVVALGSSLSNVTGGCNGFHSPGKAYFSGSRDGTGRAIASITFATDTVAALGAQLSVGRIRGAGYGSAARGYVAGGATLGNVYYQSIDRMTFASEAIALLGAQLDRTKADTEGASSAVNGYDFGGMAGVATNRATTFRRIGALELARESWRVVQENMARGGRFAVSVSRR